MKAIRSNPRVTLLVVLVGILGCGSGNAASVSEDKTSPTREVFVLPPNYRGPFIAIYGQRDALPPRWHVDTAVFSVSKSGVVRIGYPEPEAGTHTVHVFFDKPAESLGNYPTCADMRVHVKDTRVAVCWLDYQVHRQDTPAHIVAVITDWQGIPANFERTATLYDSVLFGGKGIALRKWEEPRDLTHVRGK